jgi:ABC-2 type transport system permease protein
MSAWLATIGPALLLLVLHVVWVLRTDTAFEEAAATASTAQAERLENLRTRGLNAASLTPKRAKLTLPLSPTGWPAGALVWKNVLWLVRTGQIRGILLFPGLAAVVAVAFAGRSVVAEMLVVILCLSVATMILVFGPATMRNDLRGELRRLPLLKTMPLSGRDILVAEVASSATPTAVMQYLLVAVAVVAMSFTGKDPLTPGMRTGVLIGAPVFLLGLSLANFTIHNGLALLFPGWVKVGESGAAGVEAMGQMMLTSVLTFTMLALLLVVPAIVGAVVYVTIMWPPLVATASTAIAAGLALAAESWLVMTLLGSSLEKLEPQQV